MLFEGWHIHTHTLQSEVESRNYFNFVSENIEHFPRKLKAYKFRWAVKFCALNFFLFVFFVFFFLLRFLLSRLIGTCHTHHIGRMWLKIGICVCGKVHIVSTQSLQPKYRLKAYRRIACWSFSKQTNGNHQIGYLYSLRKYLTMLCAANYGFIY